MFIDEFRFFQILFYRRKSLSRYFVFEPNREVKSEINFYRHQQIFVALFVSAKLKLDHPMGQNLSHCRTLRHCLNQDFASCLSMFSTIRCSSQSCAGFFEQRSETKVVLNQHRASSRDLWSIFWAPLRLFHQTLLLLANFGSH